MTFLIFVIILSILIIVHEAGHFLMAKRLGIKVEEFALGFGPKLFGWAAQGTEYRICAIPLGGYVRMAGDERSRHTGRTDEFLSQPAFRRFLVIVMGPVVNYLLAFVCFALMFKIGYVDMEASMKKIPAQIGQIMAGSPAEKAGLRPGDKVVEIDGKPVNNWPQMQEMVSDSKGKQLSIQIERDGERTAVAVTPETQKTKDLFGREHGVSRIGVQPKQVEPKESMVVRRYGVAGSLKHGAEELWSITTKTYAALWEILTGQRSAKEGVTGLVGMFFIIKFAASVGFSFLLHIVGVISASLAIFNLLPLIPLDGGHIFLLGIEKLRGRPLSPRADEFFTKAGLGLIIALALFVFYIDFERIGVIDKIMQMFK